MRLQKRHEHDEQKLEELRKEMRILAKNIDIETEEREKNAISVQEVSLSFS